MKISIKLYLLLTVILSFSSFILCAQQDSNMIVGKWMTVEKNLLVEVYKQDSNFKAKILWFNDSDDKTRPLNERLDAKNPDTNLRTRKWVGMEVLKNLRYDNGDNKWEDGKIYDPNTGKEWDSEAWLTKDNLLKVKGYWVFKFLSKTLTFKRA